MAEGKQLCTAYTKQKDVKEFEGAHGKTVKTCGGCRSTVLSSNRKRGWIRSLSLI